jgi:hypothetical protein
MKITSQPSCVNASIQQLKEFLGDCRNLIHLLPQDQITDWNSEIDWCSFKVQGGISITLTKDENEPEFNLIRLKSGDKSPFPFNLVIFLEAENEETKGYIEFDGDVNVFLKMMIERPLTNLFNTMTENLKSYFLNSK